MILTKEQATWVDQQITLLEEAILDETGRRVTLSINGADNTLELMVNDIVTHVCQSMHIPVVLLLSPSRKEKFVFGRYVCFFMIRMFCAAPHPSKLAPLFNRDRSSIISAYEEMDKLVNTNHEVFNKYLNDALSTYQTEQYETAS